MKLRDILNEFGTFFGNVAFGDPDQFPSSTYPALLKLQGKGKKDKEKNTRREDDLLDALASWVTSSSAGKSQSDTLTKLLPVIRKGKKLFPSVFAPSEPDGTPVYRGLKNTSEKLLRRLAKETTEEDWVVDGKYMWCKKPIKYSPHSDWQSWSYDEKKAKAFSASSMLKTKQDANFYFNPKTLKSVFGSNEQEIIHQGKEYSSEVYIGLMGYMWGALTSTWDEMRRGNKNRQLYEKQRKVTQLGREK